MNTRSSLAGVVIVATLILTGHSAFASSNLSGTVIDPQRAPIPFANVLLLNEDSTLVKGAITTEDGHFRMDDIARGNYLLSVSMLGFKTVYQSLDLRDAPPLMQVGNIQMEEDIAQLQEVEIKARKPLFEQQMDRLVINVQNSITSGGGSALDVLQKSPGVRVNLQGSQGTISMGGKSGVIVMINGKDSRIPVETVIQMLQNMPAENIEKIELLTSPPAKYDSEGNAGFINIVLVKNENYGTNGSFFLKTGYGNAEKYGGGINFNHRSGRMNLYGDYTYSADHSKQVFEGTRSLLYENLETNLSTRSDRDSYTPYHSGRLGIDYELSDKTILGALFSGYDSKWMMDAFNAVNLQENGAPVKTMGITNDEVNHWQHLMGNLNLQHNISEGQSLSFNFDYLHYLDVNPTNYFNDIRNLKDNTSSAEQFRSSKRTPINIWVGKMDYAKSLGEKLKLETGLKGSFYRFENDIRVENRIGDNWEPDRGLTQFVNLREDVLAAYASLIYTVSEKTTFYGGLRYEHTTSNLSSPEEKDIVDRQYGNLFPNISITQQLENDQTLQLSYNRRISRPTFNDLAPFVIFFDPFTFITGNPALQPAIASTVKADYRLKTWLFSASFTHEDEAIVMFQNTIDPETNRQTSASANLDFLNTWNTMMAFPLYFTDWWESQNTVMVLWQQAETSLNDDPIRVSQRSLNFSSAHSFKLPKNFSLELSGFYQSASLWGYSRMNALGSVNLGVRKAFGDGSQLSIIFSDMFRNNKWVFITDIPEQYLNSRELIQFENRKVMLTYTRNFGSQKVKSARQRGTGSDEERRRVSN